MWPLRLRRVVGYEGRSNDVLFHPAATRSPDHDQTLVFFGGDIQDYPEIMEAHPEYKNFVRWNLENTARMLAGNFPDRHIVIVRPSRIEYKSFSCYDNFVPSDNTGVPEHTPNYGALLHLHRLLQGVTNRLKQLSATELLDSDSGPGRIANIDDKQTTSQHVKTQQSNGSRESSGGSQHKPVSSPPWWREVPLEESALSLVGFSKGCVVLNQLTHEVHYTNTVTPGNTNMLRLISQLRELWWVEGGHGGRGAWLTDTSLLRDLARTQASIMVHVSPYQVEDEARPWLGREERAFTDTLTNLGANISRFLHKSPGMKKSLEMHFQVLENFKRVHDSQQKA